MRRKSAAGDVELEVLRLMTELARYLLSVGIAVPRMTAITRLAYFRAASTEARFANEKLNQSSVAAMTGLTRVQVRQFAKQASLDSNRPRNRIDAVLSAWSADPAFTTSKFLPRRLRVAGAGTSFAELVKRHGGDVTPRAMLRELQRNGFVSVKDGYVILKALATTGRGDHRTRVIARSVAALIECSGVPAKGFPTRGLNLETEFPAAKGKLRALIQRRAEAGLKSYVEALHTMGLATESTESGVARRDNKRTRARILMIMEDVDK